MRGQLTLILTNHMGVFHPVRTTYREPFMVLRKLSSVPSSLWAACIVVLGDIVVGSTKRLTCTQHTQRNVSVCSVLPVLLGALGTPVFPVQCQHTIGVLRSNRFGLSKYIGAKCSIMKRMLLWTGHTTFAKSTGAKLRLSGLWFEGLALNSMPVDI